jgi:type II secretion system protein J
VNCVRRHDSDRSLFARAFTLVEVMIAITILSLILAAIYASWTAILRASKTGKDVGAAVQRARMAVRVLEDSLTSARSFTANYPFYGFMAENGDEATLSFVARLANSFPRAGKFGDLDVRRLTFKVESARDGSRNLVLHQVPLLMETDEDEKVHPVILARNVRKFSMQFWDIRKNDWVDEWTRTNEIPKLLQFSLKLSSNPNAPGAEEEVGRIVSIPAIAVPLVWQTPRAAQAPGSIPPGGVPGGVPGVVPGVQPGVQPGFVPQQPGNPPGGVRQ